MIGKRQKIEDSAEITGEMSMLNDEIRESFSQLLNDLASCDNVVRSMAEKLIEKEWGNIERMEFFLIFLAEQTQYAECEKLKQFAAILFRKIIIKSPSESVNVTDKLISFLNTDVKLNLLNILLKSFMRNISANLKHKLADAISELINIDVLSVDECNKTLKYLIDCLENSDPILIESIFRIFSSTPELLVKNYFNEILYYFVFHLKNDNENICVSVINCFVSILQESDNDKLPMLQSIYPYFLDLMSSMIKKSQFQSLESVLNSMIELVELAPNIFIKTFDRILDICFTISKSKNIDSFIRMSALELLTSFAEAFPSLCKSNSLYIESILLITLSMLTEISINDENAIEWINNENDDEIEYETARQTLDRVSLKLNGDVIVPVLFQYLSLMISSNSWREKHAALMALSSIVEGCSNILIHKIENIMMLIMPINSDTHPRVQYAFCNALGQMSTDFSGFFQKMEGEKVLKALISKLGSNNVTRVQCHAAAALVNFSEMAPKSVLKPFLDELFHNLFNLLRSQAIYVQEQSLTTIAIIANTVQTDFNKYYEILMPTLIDILKMDTNNENKLLKAKSIECSTLTSLAVGKSNFERHRQYLIQLLWNIQENSKDDEIIMQHLDQGWCRICTIIGKDFVPYLPFVLNSLLTAAKCTQDIFLLDDEQKDDFNSNEDWDVINFSGKFIAVHTAVLDDKVTAINLLRTYSNQLKGDFNPWVNEVINEVCIPSLDFYLHDDVRISAALTITPILKCAFDANNGNTKEINELWTKVSNKLIDILKNESVPDLIITYYTTLVESIKLIGPNSLTSTQVILLFNSINSNLLEIYNQKNSKNTSISEYQKNSNDCIDYGVLNYINKVIHSIIKVSKVGFSDSFEILIPTISMFLNYDDTDLLICGLKIISRLIEFYPVESVTYKDLFLNVISNLIYSSNSNISEAALYTIGVIALFGGINYKDFCLNSLKHMFKIALVEDSRHESKIIKTEISIASIGKIIRNFSNSILDLDLIIDQWICLLPIIKNIPAAFFSYSFLKDLISIQHPSVLNRIQKVFSSIIEALSNSSISGSLAEGIVAVTKQLLSLLPQNEALKLFENNGLNDDVVRKWFS